MATILSQLVALQASWACSLRRRPARWLPAMGFAALILLTGGAALAQSPAAGSSSAMGEAVSLNVLPLLGSPVVVTSGPLPTVSAAAPPSSASATTPVSVVAGVPMLGTVLQTGVLRVNASSQTLPTATAEGDATVNAARLNVGALASVLGFGADTIASQATLSCSSFVPTVTGSTTLTNPRVTLLGLPLAIDPTPAANTVLVDILGLRVVLNEQIVSTSAFATDLVVNAVHVSIDALALSAGMGVLTGDIVVAHSHANLGCFVAE